MGGTKLSIAICGLALLSASPSWAGSGGGNTGTATPGPASRYGICYADGAMARYLTPVFTYAVGPKTGPNLFGLAFSKYLSATYPGEGRGIDARCDVEDAKGDADAWKKSTEARSRTKIVETNWGP